MSNTEHPPDRWSQSLESATPPVALPDAFVLSVGMNIEIISRAHSLLKIRHLIFRILWNGLLKQPFACPSVQRTGLPGPRPCIALLTNHLQVQIKEDLCAFRFSGRW